MSESEELRRIAARNARKAAATRQVGDPTVKQAADELRKLADELNKNPAARQRVQQVRFQTRHTTTQQKGWGPFRREILEDRDTRHAEVGWLLYNDTFTSPEGHAHGPTKYEIKWYLLGDGHQIAKLWYVIEYPNKPQPAIHRNEIISLNSFIIGADFHKLYSAANNLRSHMRES